MRTAILQSGLKLYLPKVLHDLVHDLLVAVELAEVQGNHQHVLVGNAMQSSSIYEKHLYF